MVDTVIDIVFKDFDGRHNFTENKHPRKPDGHFNPTPPSTHYEATHGEGQGKKALALARKRIRNARNRRKRATSAKEGSDE